MGTLPNERKRTIEKARIFHVAIFVPPEHVEKVLESIVQVDPLIFGPYKRSAWWSAVGTEQFEPMPGSEPTVGEAGKVEKVATVRVEFAIPADQDLLERIVSEGILPAHPWQTPAILISEATAVMTT